MTPGTDVITVGDKILDEYLPQEILRMDVKSPLVVSRIIESYSIKNNVYSGGLTGQAGDMRHSNPRALLEAGNDFREILNWEGFLTLDSRVKESKKYGLKGARRATQFSKR